LHLIIKQSKAKQSKENFFFIFFFFFKMILKDYSIDVV
jgi:hypothetical protein